MTIHTIRLLLPEEARARRAELVELLFDAVDGGASVNFVKPMTREKSEMWWKGALDSHARGERLIFAADAEGRLDGTVQLVLAPQENQSFRGDIAKLLVHRRARRLGLGWRLMEAAEAEALRIGRTLLTLDTEAASAADALYRNLGWTRVGVIPGYATNAENNRREDCSFFYKDLT